MFPSTDSPKNAVDMFPRTDTLKWHSFYPLKPLRSCCAVGEELENYVDFIDCDSLLFMNGVYIWLSKKDF